MGRPSAQWLFSLLNKPKAQWQYQSKKNNGDGGWTYGRVRDLTVGGVESHLTGEYPKGFCYAAGGFANFLAWDVDENFELLAPFIVDELKKRKWERGAGATDGSSAGRGKIVQFIRPRIPQAVAIRHSEEIRRAVIERAEAELLLKIDPEKFTAYPKNGCAVVRDTWPEPNPRRQTGTVSRPQSSTVRLEVRQAGSYSVLAGRRISS